MHKGDAGARKSRKFEEIFRPGRRHSELMQNLRVQSTAENLIGFVSLPGQKLSSNLLFIDFSEHRNTWDIRYGALMQQRVKSFSTYLVKNKSKVNADTRKGHIMDAKLYIEIRAVFII